MKQIDPTLPKPAPAKVMVVHVSAAGGILSGPFIIPGMGTPPTTDDMAAITTVGTTAGHRGVGVLWSNQVAGEEAFYFAAHTDGAPDLTWGARETAFGGSGTLSADGHLSVKTDSTGRVIAAVKTNKTTGTAELIGVLARTGNSDAAGAWTNRSVSSVQQHGTRPVLVLDSENNFANVFFTETDNPQIIYRRTAALSTLDFGANALGTAFISHAATATINNATSTKQITDATSGIIVQAADIATRTYFHGCAGAVCPAVPVAGFSGTPLTGEAPLTVQFTDASTGNPANWAWNFGDGGTSTLPSPSHTFNSGTWTVSLTVTNALGTDAEVKTAYVVVTVPTKATYKPLEPARLLDSRIGVGLSGKFVDGVPRSFQVTGQGGVPGNATAVTGNITIVNQTKRGSVTLGPTPNAAPTFSTINFPVTDIRANGVTVALSGSGQLAAVYKSNVGGTIDLVFDVTGYFVRDNSGSTYHALEPARLLDTRVANGLGGKFHDSVPRTFQVTGRGGVPAGATAVTGNLTIVNQTNRGSVTLGPTPIAAPTFSTINFPITDIRANGVTVALGGGGTLSAVYKAKVAAAKIDLVFDVTGYFTSDLSGAKYVPLEPTRLLDTRVANGLGGKFHDSVPRTFQVTTRASIPTTATAVTGNLTIVNQTNRGSVTLGPTPIAAPTFSTINFPITDIRANGVTVALGGGGTLSAVYKAKVAAAKIDLVFDVTGYFE